MTCWRSPEPGLRGYRGLPRPSRSWARRRGWQVERSSLPAPGTTWAQHSASASPQASSSCRSVPAEQRSRCARRRRPTPRARSQGSRTRPVASCRSCARRMPPNARGVIAGVSTDTTLADLVRAAVVGVVCSLLDGADRLTGADESGPIRLVGGGARSAAYRQAVADLAQRAVVAPDPDREWVAYGAAVQAAGCLAGLDITEIGARWGRPPRATMEPTMSPDRSTALRERHRALVASETG